MLSWQEETDVNNLRLIATVGIFLVMGADNLFAQQANILNVSSQQVDPAVLDLPIAESTVNDIHLRPLFTTTIRLPEPVTSVAVGAPTLFKVEHSTDDPRLVFIKPTSAGAAVPTGVNEFPFQSIVVECPLCGGKRRYLPSEIFLGRVDQLVNHQMRTRAI